MVNEGVLVLDKMVMGVETVTVRPIIVVILLKLKRCLLQMVDNGTLVETFEFQSRDMNKLQGDGILAIAKVQKLG